MAEPLKLPIEQLRFNADGLIPAIAQDWLDGAVLMVAWMNRQALELTLRQLNGFPSGEVHGPPARFRGRGRGGRGGTSGNSVRALTCDHAQLAR